MACKILCLIRQAVLQFTPRWRISSNAARLVLVEVNKCIASIQVCSGSLLLANSVPAVRGV